MRRDEPDTASLRWSDAWLLHAILVAAQGTGVADIIDVLWMGDALNHAVFTGEELNGGIVRLERAGLISYVKPEFHVTAEAAAIYERVKADDAYGVTEAIRRVLGASAPGSAPPRNDTPSPPSDARITRDELDTAYRGYHEAFQQQLRELRRRDP
jgi:hypothetical protein